MTSEQLIPAFIAALREEGVPAQIIERAVSRVRDIKLGHSVTGSNPERRAFANEQTKLLERAL